MLVADGHLGIWPAASEICPHTEEQRCWNHRILNVLDKPPKSVQSEARALLTQIPYAPTREVRKKPRDQICQTLSRPISTGRGHTRTRLGPHGDVFRLSRNPLAPAYHQRHRESLRFHPAAAKRYKKVANATALIWHILMVAYKRFRKLNAPHLMAAVYAGVCYQHGSSITQKKSIAA